MAGAGEGHQRPGYVLLLTTVCLGGVLAPLNSTMLAVALPEIREGFSVGHAEIAWLVSAYLIAMAVAQPVGGRLGDQSAGRACSGRGWWPSWRCRWRRRSPDFSSSCRAPASARRRAVIPNGMAMLEQCGAQAGLLQRPHRVRHLNLRRGRPADRRGAAGRRLMALAVLHERAAGRTGAGEPDAPELPGA
jgi:hypothetical protein